MKLTREQVEKAAQLYREGKSLEELGESYGVHYTTIRLRLIAAGVAMRPKGMPKGSTLDKYSQTRADACDLYGAGLTLAEVGRVLGMSRQGVQQHLIRAGVGRRSPGPKAHAASPQRD